MHGCYVECVLTEDSTLAITKVGQTEFAIYRHHPHGFSDFRSNTVNIQYLGPHPLKHSN